MAQARDRNGRFAGGGSKRSVTRSASAGGRSAAAFKPPVPASRVRAGKAKIKDVADLSRGVRAPRSRSEREMLEYASPKKIREAVAKTGTARMPRKEAIKANVSVAKLFQGRTPAGPRTVTTTFTGKRRAKRT